MKLYVVPALFAGGLNTVLACIVLCVSIFYVYTDQNVNPPVEPNKAWIHLIKLQIPFAAFWMGLGLVGMYVSMTRKQMWSSTLILILYGAVLGIAIYFAISFGNQLEVENLDPHSLLKATLRVVHKKGEEGWLPEWLDNIQKKSSSCCGIRTFRDYEDFWPTSPSRMPRSCCKDAKTVPAACPKDLTLIPFPNTPDDFFKVESGCMDEIMEVIRHHAKDSYQNTIIMATFIAVALFTFGVLYTRRYLDGPDKPPQRVAAVEGGDAENRGQEPLETTSEPIFTGSSGLVGSADSFEGVKTGSRDPLRPTLSGPQFSKQNPPVKQYQQSQQFRVPASTINQSSLQIQIRPQPITQSQQQLSPTQLQLLQQQYQTQQSYGVPVRDPYATGRSYPAEPQGAMPTPSKMATLPQTSSLDNLDPRGEQYLSDGTGSPPGTPMGGAVRKKRVRREPRIKPPPQEQ